MTEHEKVTSEKMENDAKKNEEEKKDAVLEDEELEKIAGGTTVQPLQPTVTGMSW